jgi:hypothetical protein
MEKGFFMNKKLLLSGLLAFALIFGLVLAACSNGSTDESPDDGTNWYAWNSTVENGGYASTTVLSITPLPDNTGCDVSVTGTADALYHHNAQLGYDSTRTAGITYIVSWKWQASGSTFDNVHLRYAQSPGPSYQPEYFINLDGNPSNDQAYGPTNDVLAIPTTEQTKSFEFTMPAAECKRNFVFYVGGDTGDFKIWDFKIVKKE